MYTIDITDGEMAMRAANAFGVMAMPTLIRLDANNAESRRAVGSLIPKDFFGGAVS
jgi:hypothetical protein